MCCNAEILKVAVVGAGYWGPNLVRCFSGHEHTSCEYLCDLDLEAAARVARRFPGVRTTSDFDAVLNDPNVDAVAIATPVSTHFDLASRALRAGKHTLVEKPLALTGKEGERLVSLAADQDLRLMCDHTFCYTAVVRRMQEIVSQGELGDILYFDSVRVNLGLFQSDINVLWDLCPHDLSIIDFVLPEDMKPVAVAAQGIDAANTGFESVAHLTLHFEKPMMAHIHANWLAPVKVRTMLLGGTRKMLVWDDTNPAERLKIYDKGINVSSEDREKLLVSYRHGEARIPVLDNSEALMNMVGEFASSISERRAPLTDGHAGLRVLRSLEAADKSLTQGGLQIKLPT